MPISYPVRRICPAAGLRSWLSRTPHGSRHSPMFHSPSLYPPPITSYFPNHVDTCRDSYINKRPDFTAKFPWARPGDCPRMPKSACLGLSCPVGEGGGCLSSTEKHNPRHHPPRTNCRPPTSQRLLYFPKRQTGSPVDHPKKH